jgi:hypothetical protein
MSATGHANLQDMPDEIAARQAGRATSALPLDCWVVAAVQQASTGHGLQGEQKSRQIWQPSGVYLDVSQRGGAILNQQQLHARYPDAAQALEGKVQKVGP